METIKISELSQAGSLEDLYTIGVDGDNRSVKVSLDYIKTQVDIVNEADAAAVFANIAGDEAEKAAEKANEAAQEGFDAAYSCRDAADAALRVVSQTMAVPSIDIRVVRRREPTTSMLYPEEETSIMVDELQYRINGMPGQIDAFRREGWQITLLRPRWVRGGKELCYKKWAACEIGSSAIEDDSEAYPLKSQWTRSEYRSNDKVLWGGRDVNNISKIDIDPNIHANGEWRPFPHSLEKLIRRYVYMQRVDVTNNKVEILPLSCFRSDYEPITKSTSVAFLRLVGRAHKQCVFGRPKIIDVYGRMEESTSSPINLIIPAKQARYVSLPFALALSKNIDGKYSSVNTNYEKRIDGPRTYFTAIFRWADESTMHYTAKISGLGKPRTVSIIQ